MSRRNSGDYYTTIDQMFQENPQPITPLVVCPKCKGGLREIHNLKKDGSRRKNDKILDLHCQKCDFLISSIKDPNKSTQKA